MLHIKVLIISIACLFHSSHGLAVDFNSESQCKDYLKDWNAHAGDPDKLNALSNKCPLTAKLVLWKGLVDAETHVPFDYYVTFVAENPRWPWQFKIIRHAEKAISGEEPSELLISWFKKNFPRTLKGAKHYIHALKETDRTQESITVTRQVWHNIALTKEEETEFLKLFASSIREQDSLKRIENQIDAGDHKAAARTLKFISVEKRGILVATIALMQNSGDAGKEAMKHPNALKNNPKMILAYFKWLVRNENPKAVAYFENIRHIVNKYPHKFIKIRLTLARDLFKVGNYSMAYDVLQDHGLSSGADYAEAEWYLGWLALRFLNQAMIGKTHFEQMYEHVKSPISRGRAAYWAGRAWEDFGNPQKAIFWYSKAYHHPSTYYGQLASLRLKKNQYTLAFKPLNIDKHAKLSFENNEFVQAIRLLSAADLKRDVLSFAYLVVKRAKGVGAQHMIVELLHNVAPLHVVSIIKEMRYGYEPFFEVAYPDIGHRKMIAAEGLEPALVNALIRKESGFDHELSSGKNAKGLMQLLPSTAKMLAQEHQIVFDEHKLLKDPEYNLKIGLKYMRQMLEKYDGNYILTLAAYNAGPGTVDKWLKIYGDPRVANTNAIDLIEKLPYRETREYIQRVFEDLTIYRKMEKAHG